MKILIVGGVGYLGFNLSMFHRERGDQVYIVARRGSLEKRKSLVDDLTRIGVRIEVLDTLSKPSLDSIDCPDIAYVVVGKLRGTRSLLFESNVAVPRAWAIALAQKCHERSLIVYSSSLLAVGDPAQCSEGPVVREEERHLEGCKPIGIEGLSKAEGEKGVLEACSLGSHVLVARLGLLVGRWAYHPEWRLMLRLARLGVRLARGPLIHATPASDLAKVALSFLGAGGGCSWVYAAPWRLRLGELHAALLRLAGRTRAVPLPVPPGLPLGPSLLKAAYVQSRYRFESRHEFIRAIDWTPLDKALAGLVYWARGAGLV